MISIETLMNGKIPKMRKLRTIFELPSKTEQDHKDKCDLNNKVARARNQQEQKYAKKMFFGDFTDAKDYHDAMNSVIKARNSFNSLDPKIRLRFENNPLKLMEFLQNDNNRAEAIELGFVDPPEIKEVLLQKKSNEVPGQQKIPGTETPQDTPEAK